MAVAGLLYSAGLVRLWSASAAGRGVTVAQAFCYGIGFASLALALFSPLDHHADNLFYAHMVQHELLMLIAAPLIAPGRSGAVVSCAIPRGTRPALAARPGVGAAKRIWRAATHPVGAGSASSLRSGSGTCPRFTKRRSRTLPCTGSGTPRSFLPRSFWVAVLDRPRRADAHGLALAAAFTTVVHACALVRSSRPRPGSGIRSMRRGRRAMACLRLRTSSSPVS